LQKLKEAFNIVSFNDNVYLNYIKLYRELKKKGKLKSEGDLLIASFCIAYDLKLWTKNIKDFEIFEKYGLKMLKI
jgi:predicted nucleic acid-binding protein